MILQTDRQVYECFANQNMYQLAETCFSLFYYVLANLDEGFKISLITLVSAWIFFQEDETDLDLKEIISSYLYQRLPVEQNVSA